MTLLLALLLVLCHSDFLPGFTLFRSGGVSGGLLVVFVICFCFLL